MNKGILYSVTVNIDDEKHDDWLGWMKRTHIPDVMATGCFDRFLLGKVLAESEGGVSYSIQYIAKNQKHLETYMEKFAPNLKKQHHDRYVGHYVAFRTLVEVVDMR